MLSRSSRAASSWASRRPACAFASVAQVDTNDDSRCIGEGVDFALGGTPLPIQCAWLTASQRERMKAIARQIVDRGPTACALSPDDLRFCVGLQLLCAPPRSPPLKAGDAPLGAGGAQLILSPARSQLLSTTTPR